MGKNARSRRGCSLRRRLASAGVVLACALGLAGCAPADHGASPEPAPPGGAQAAGDEALPELNGGFAYTMVQVVSKDAGADSLEVRVLPWDVDGAFVRGGLEAGETGEVSCAHLVLFPAGIPDGHVVVVASPASDADAFPLAAHSIEKPDWFEARLARDVSA